MIKSSSQLLFSQKGFLLTVVLVFTTFSLFAQLKVACVGNSITAGYGLKQEQSYPAQMQIILGNKYEVRNFGVSARTLLSKGDLPYIKEEAYKQVLEWQPNIVIIKLGTNDTKPWNWKYKEEYVSDYVLLIESFKKLPTHPNVNVCVCLPIPVFEDKWGISDSTITKGVIPMVKKVAKMTRSKIINLYKPFVGKNNLVFDGIHPTVQGDSLLARLVAKAIR